MFSFLARMGLDTTGFTLGVKRAEGQAAAFSKNVNSSIKGQIAAAFGAGAIVAGFKSAIDKAGQLSDAANRIGVNPEILQQREHALKQSGATLEDYERALIGIGRARAKALENPQGDEMAAFKRMGVTLEQIKSSNADDIFLAIADRVKEAGNSQGVLNDSLSLMGKIAPSVFSAMSNGIRESGSEAKELGLVLSEDTIDDLDELGDFFDLVKTKIISGFATMANAALKFGKSLQNSFEIVATGIMTAWDWLVENQGKNMGAKDALAGLWNAFEEGAAQAWIDVEKRNQDEADKREEKRKKRDRPRIEFQGLADGTIKQKVEMLKPENITNLQKIGAQVSESNAAMSILRDQLAVQKQIAANTKPGPTGEGGFE
jgi:hypothetical protein